MFHVFFTWFFLLDCLFSRRTLPINFTNIEIFIDHELLFITQMLSILIVKPYRDFIYINNLIKMFTKTYSNLFGEAEIA